MANGENAAADPADVMPAKQAASSAQDKPRARRAASSGTATSSKPAPVARESRAADQPQGGAGEPAEPAAGDDQESLAHAAEALASRLGVVPAPAVDHALGAGRRASMATIRAHRLVVEFHLGQLERTLRAGRALTNCRSFEDAVEVHRLFMQETLRASAAHLRDLAGIGLGAGPGEPAAGQRK